MQIFNIKSIILGVGIGIVIASGTGMLYSSSVSLKAVMTKEEIMLEAEKYGMVKSSQIFATATPTPKIETTIVPTTMPSPAPTTTPVPAVEITITVNSGDTATMVTDKLIEAKVITDRNSFIQEMLNSRAAYTIFPGNYTLKQEMPVNEVIKILTAKKEF